MAPTTATSTAGTRRETRGIASRTANTISPTASVAPLVPSSPSKNALTSARNESADVENPNSFGSCPTMIVTASPFM